MRVINGLEIDDAEAERLTTEAITKGSWVLISPDAKIWIDSEPSELVKTLMDACDKISEDAVHDNTN